MNSIQGFAASLLHPIRLPGKIFGNGASESVSPRSVEIPASVQAPEKSEPTSFDKVLDKLVTEVSDKMETAATDQQKVLTGETGNLHQAMISMQEASVSFSLMVEVRNKLVESYQELMRMQV